MPIIPVINTYSFSDERGGLLTAHVTTIDRTIIAGGVCQSHIWPKREKKTSRSLAMPITQSSRIKKIFFLLEDWCGLLQSTAHKCRRCDTYPRNPASNSTARKDKRTINLQTRRTFNSSSAYSLAWKDQIVVIVVMAVVFVDHTSAVSTQKVNKGRMDHLER